jgi:hypothetical protein
MPPLAPLQIVMLRDSLCAQSAESHVEQLEITFASPFTLAEIAAAWAAVVRATQALRMNFITNSGEPFSWNEVTELPSVAAGEPHDGSESSLHQWRLIDRSVPLLHQNQVPWRCTYWAEHRCFIWTFHHALLDGRSIIKILSEFITTLCHRTTPVLLALSTWPEAVPHHTADFFRKEFAGILPTPPEKVAAEPTPKSSHSLGENFLTHLEMIAKDNGVSVCNFITWAWAQAVMNVSEMNYAIIEQVRCGPPHHGAAGFTMSLIPFVIRRAPATPLRTQLQSLRQKLTSLRDIEAISEKQLPPEVAALTRHPWSSVLMTEHHTLSDHLSSHHIESVHLHENPTVSLTATAYLRPHLHLAVEGPHHAALLHAWIQICTADDGFDAKFLATLPVIPRKRSA